MSYRRQQRPIRPATEIYNVSVGKPWPKLRYEQGKPLISTASLIMGSRSLPSLCARSVVKRSAGPYGSFSIGYVLDKPQIQAYSCLDKLTEGEYHPGSYRPAPNTCRCRRRQTQVDVGYLV